MKYAIFSDLHANADAFRRAIADARSCGAAHFVCLGDIVGYGPMPVETLAAARRLCATVVAGNHDDAVSGRMSTADFIDLAGDAVSRHRAELSSEDRSWLKSLPHTAAIEGAAIAHGDFTNPRAFNYIQNEEDAAANFAATRSQLMFVGHTHVPTIAITGESGRTYLIPPQDFVVEDGKRYIVNPGSVGYPRERDGVCRSTYVIYDSTARSIHFRSLPFAVSSVLQRGNGSRGTPRWAVRGAWCLALGALCLALGVWCFVGRTPQPATPPAEPPKLSEPLRPPEPPKPSKPSSVLDERRLTIPPSATKAVANLKVKSKSGPVLLTLRFLDANGKELHTDELKIKQVCKRPFPIPKSSVTCIITVSRCGGGKKRPSFTLSPSLR